ncbi:MAG: hypothetical protein CVU06_05755, partial [Bacteroidetes bacterium HGW-Bacteroidetes-22]
RSQNYGSKERLGRAIRSILGQFSEPGLLVLEGGGRISTLWTTIAIRSGWSIETLHAEEWRRNLINPSEWQFTTDLKDLSVSYATIACQWGGQPVAGVLNHNTAEAILTGLWVLVKRGFITKTPWLLPIGYRSK